MEFYEAHHPTSLGRFIRGKMGVPPTALLDALTLRVCDCDPRPPPRAPTSHPSSRSVVQTVTFSAMRSLVGTRRRGRQECTPRLNPPQNGPGIFPTPERWITCHRRPPSRPRPPSSLATDLRPRPRARAMVRGGFIFITKRVRGPFLASAALTPRRSVRPILIEFKATSLLFI